MLHPRIEKALVRLVRNPKTAFYGTLALNLIYVESRSVPTAAVDGKRCFYNPDFVDTLADDEVEFLICHEVMHVANLHHTRRNGRDLEQWNVAADYVINLDLADASVGKMPTGGLLDRQYADLSAEEVFAILDRPAPPQRPQKGEGEGEGGEGEQEGDQTGGDGDTDEEGDKPGNGGGDDTGDEGEGDGGDKPHQITQDAGHCGGVIDAVGDDAEIAQQEREWQQITRQAVAIATKSAGHIPEDLKRLADELEEPKQDWREVLRRYADPSLRFDYLWTSPDRRFGTAPYVLPGPVAIEGVNHLVIAVDTSGSIVCSPKALALFRAEIQAIADEHIVERFTIIYCDAQIHGVAEFEAGDKIVIEPKGGGWTSFVPVFNWLNDNAQDATALVYFTDLMGEFPAREAGIPTLWAVYGDPRYLRQNRPPFGEAIAIT